MGTSLALLPGLPLLGAAALLLSGRRTDRWGHVLATALVFASFGLAVAAFVSMLDRPVDERRVGAVLFSWVPAPNLSVDAGLALDPLSICFVLLITGVGGLVHVYSMAYMRDDPHRRRFFAYLNLFVAAMLVLVMADNFLGLYLGWEGVGLASYLLIGFWSHKPSAATAARKAFVVNRVGDIGLAVALMIMVAEVGSVSYDAVFAAAGTELGQGTTTALGLLLLLAACGKSAQVPLQSWLGDAMEGPTPVSALIHAATMVTAGVYLIVRSGAIFEAAPAAQTAVVAVGAVTLLAGAIIGCAKDDIKKALAASTMSQIGYMVLAAGLGPAGYAVAIMHLLTHGFFKAGLFLGAGSVMHAMNDETDMRRYGGLARVLPVTAVTFGLAYLAIIGVPPFAGFWSKDGIIEAALDEGGVRGVLLGGATILGAGITAFYMTRVVILTFGGRARWNADGVHPHEAPASMNAPMVILAIGSVGAGAVLAVGDRLSGWLAPVVGEHEPAHLVPVWVVTTIVLVTVAVGVGLAVRQYARRDVPVTAPTGNRLTRAARRDLYGDDLNEAIAMRPGQRLTAGVVRLDEVGVDGAVGAVTATVRAASERLRLLQNGFVRTYALSMFGGAVLVLAVTLALGSGS
ncbi:NADH-quinone oxidoreductase subunit L [Rhodococcoides corynebacterioides]|uniref:NADH-quinone oxidoreductase subunit L n=1 Tax=Rhodococcoides corynebacterioides TaxID=53972 RepID=A0ABS7P7L6_9NOCA|nr:NADH-quinone oxidoreductase subunit L [Rhodococcus corynebacterioides]MBY6368036.1 NADH-quinone oxidoreductase subunit L [Rhodococcus corynebacterioides]MBY6407511.1 NADH-quinone oxidoreductase subunit L [Rhodococcus corynebacterioides]